jgi:molybdopterin molybdotransferase
MDGFAFRFKDLQDESASGFVIGERILAGHPASKPPPPTPHALRVMTGALLPEGFDVVVPQELCRIDGERVWIPAGQEKGQHVRLAGEDLKRGELVMEAGTRLSAIHLGLMASLGIRQARVRGPLKVALLSTGDEVIDPIQGGQRREGQLFDSNRYLLRALLAKWPSLTIHDAGIVADDPKCFEKVLRDVSESNDVIISSGGVSVGEADFTRALMAGLGNVQFCTVAMRPGRPLALGRVGRALYLGLPGNPVAVAMTFWYFVAPTIDRLLGLDSRPWPLRAARAGQRIRKKRGRTEFQRARLEVDHRGDSLLFVSSNQGSGVLSSLSKYPVIAVLEHDRGTIDAGDSLSYVRIDELMG